MYKVHHVFPTTGEWGCTQVDTLCEAHAWYQCKLAGKTVMNRVVTLFGPDDEVIMKVEK
jgi:hypothetical protein